MTNHSVDERVRRIVQYATRHCDFYRRLYAEACLDIEQFHGVGDLAQLPMVVPADLIANDIRSEDSLPYRITTSSGTVGAGKTLFRTSEDSATSVEVLRRLLTMSGVGYGDRLLIGQPFDLAHLGYLTLDACRDLGIMAIPIGLGVTNEQMLRVIARYKPNAIFSSPSRVSTIIQLRDAGATPRFGFDKVLLAGEPATPEQLKRIRDAWNIEPHNLYGSEETDGLAGSCERHCGLHFMSDLFILEQIDTDGNVTNSGVGEALITSLYSKGTPLIRYRLGDILAARGACPCGRAWPLVEVLGRADDVLHLYDGIKLYAWQVENALRLVVPGYIRSQLVCTTLSLEVESVEVVVEATESTDLGAVNHALWSSSLDLNAARSIGSLQVQATFDRTRFYTTERGKVPRVVDLRRGSGEGDGHAIPVRG